MYENLTKSRFIFLQELKKPCSYIIVYLIQLESKVLQDLWRLLPSRSVNNVLNSSRRLPQLVAAFRRCG